MPDPPDNSWYSKFTTELPEDWQRIPELKPLPPSFAISLYKKIELESALVPRTWVVVVTTLSVGAGLIYALHLAFSRFVGDPRAHLPSGMLMMLLDLGIVIGTVLMLGRLMRPIYRRLARTKLGTHCPACDYDLRATADPNGPESNNAQSVEK